MTENDMQAIWDAIAAPLDPRDIKTKVAKSKSGSSTNIRYIDRTTVEARLNSVVPGDWHFQVTPISSPVGNTGQWVVKGTLTICGVVREDFGVNENEEYYDPPKAAVSDALKRCASLFGLGRELVPGHAPAAGQPTTAKPSNPPAPKAAAPKAARPYSPDALRQMIGAGIAARNNTANITEDAARKLAIKWSNILKGIIHKEEQRHEVARYLLKDTTIGSFKQITQAEHDTLDAWLTKDAPMAREEAAILADFLFNQPKSGPDVGDGENM